ncbi:hypothetical protein EKD04_021820 [Chloroflexales bacterium ZM16-3]|nr:hypothetical protein [Chloroflexales bacterium ZM16-3]
MIAITANRPPVEVHDPIADLLLHKASPDLMAPPRPRIVNHRCGKNLGEKETFDALHYLTLLFAAVGRTDFTASEIARYAPGISRGRIPAYLRGLCAKQLVDVIGHREIKGLAPAFWTAHYKIDLDRLRKESAQVVVHDLRAENLPPPLRVIRPSPGQTALELAGLPAPSGDGDNAPPPIVGGAPARPRRRMGYGRMAAARPRRGTGAVTPTPLPSGDDGSQHPAMTAPHILVQPTPQDVPSQHPRMAGITIQEVPTPLDDGNQHPWMTATDLLGAPAIPGGPQPTSLEVVGGMWGGRDVGRDVGVRAAHTPTPDDIRQLIQDSLRPAIHEALSSFGIGTTFTPVPRPQDEPIPAAPAGEPAIDAGPVAIWAEVSRQTPSSVDIRRIKEIVLRFEQPSQGHAAYWLGRALSSVALEEQAPLSINYAAGILRRMQERNDWSTEELCRRPKEQRAESIAPSVAHVATPTDRVPRGKAPAAPEAAPAGTPLPAELEQHWALVAWRQFAGPRVAITLTRAQQIIVRVTDRPAWEAVLTNWHAQYQTKANWAHFDGLLERYDREVAAGVSSATSIPTDAPRIPSSVLDYHPALENQELRRLWFGRYNDAPSKPAKQVVLRRLLAEYPLPPELMAALNIPAQTQQH